MIKIIFFVHNGRIDSIKDLKNRIFDFQIPDSPPEIRTFSNEKVRIFSILEEIQNFFDEIKIFDSNADSNGSRRARCGAGLRLFCPWQTGD